MPVSQLARQCWYARYEGGEDRDNDTHYEDQEQAAKAAARIRADYDPDTVVIEVGQLPAPCWTAQCDGPGEHPLEDGEWEWTLHGETRAEVEGWCGAYGWIVTRDGQVYCEDDAPEYDTAGLVVTEQVPRAADARHRGGKRCLT
jgi:hypothetical protein